jgi:hypothetical protein
MSPEAGMNPQSSLDGTPLQRGHASESALERTGARRRLFADDPQHSPASQRRKGDLRSLAATEECADVDSLLRKLRYQESSTAAERARNVQLTSTLSDTLRELAQRKETYLLCSAELANTRNALHLHKEDDKKREKLRREARALVVCLSANVQEAQLLTSQLVLAQRSPGGGETRGQGGQTEVPEWPRTAQRARPQSADEVENELEVRALAHVVTNLEGNMTKLLEEESNRRSDTAREKEERQHVLASLRAERALRQARDEELERARATSKEKEVALAQVDWERARLSEALGQSATELTACKERLRMLEDEFTSLRGSSTSSSMLHVSPAGSGSMINLSSSLCPSSTLSSSPPLSFPLHPTSPSYREH